MEKCNLIYSTLLERPKRGRPRVLQFQVCPAHPLKNHGVDRRERPRSPAWAQGLSPTYLRKADYNLPWHGPGMALVPYIGHANASVSPNRNTLALEDSSGLGASLSSV